MQGDHRVRVQSMRWRIAHRHLNQHRSHRLRWVVVVVVMLALLASGGTGVAAMYFVSHLPSANRFHIRYAFQNARIFDSRGRLLYNMSDPGKNAGGRVVEPLQARGNTASACRGGQNRIPLVLQNATIATEDATFYKNPGFDLLSIARAAYENIRYGRVVSGASTITQQVVRDSILNDAQTLKRKAQEVALAYEIAHRYAKRKILWFYLNSVPYGEQAYGAQAAAEAYFGRRVCTLEMAQAALLAGLPSAPSLYNPIANRALAMSRLREVLSLLKQHGYLHSRLQIRTAMAEAKRWHFASPQASPRYPQFVAYVLNQIRHMPRLRGQLYHGIDVYTTLDPRLQDLAQSTVTNQINSLAPQHVTDGALVSLDLRAPHYGWILAMVGSANYHSTTGQINMAVTPRQPGSSMKPFNYIWAFKHGVGPGTVVQDEPVELPDPNDTLNHGWYVPVDYDHQWHGTVTVRQALANSLNVPAVKVEYYVTGSNNVAATAARYGMDSLYRDNPGLACSVCYSVTLGGLARGTRLLEETSAYGVFATGGETVPPIAIWKIVKRGTGKVLFCSSDCPARSKPPTWITRQRKRVLDPAHAYEMTNVLSDNNARCTVQVCEFGLVSPLLLSHPAAAKTGTTNSFTDNWTEGYTPQIVTGVWAGNADRSPMVNVIGVTGAAPIWHDYMEGAFKILNLPPVPFIPPPNVFHTPQCTPASVTVTPSTPSTGYLYPPTATPTPIPTPAFPGTIPGAVGFGSNDLWIRGDPYPLCNLAERGFLPISCAQYPQPVPAGWECPGGYTQAYPPTSGYPGSTSYYPGPGSSVNPSFATPVPNPAYPTPVTTAIP